MEFEQMLIEAPYTALKNSLLNLPKNKRAQAISIALEWSGSDIFDLMIDALIDANFHTEATALRAAWINAQIDAEALAHEALTNQN